ncbi:NAD(P)/FAD-dependent oxidoreductase [Limnobacter sp.]|uniref:NAD(P)/FAD-dependent oxidoreductase n=1 Tax=Limnobacter sp. TaxID=2003368 RepID=UPI002FE177CE
MNTPELSRFDVAVIGGGIVGSSVAYHLLQGDPQLLVAVIEPDPGYEFASTPRASGGCRVQFTCPENIAMSLDSIEFIKKFDAIMGTEDHPAHADWVEGGYLFLVSPEHITALEKNARLQLEHGCVVDLLSPDELKSRFPSMNVSDLGLGALTPQDGWCNPKGLLWGFRRKAVELGAQYIQARVVAANLERTKVKSLVLDDGRVLRADGFVNAAGAWAGEVAAHFDMPLPIKPLSRLEHYFMVDSPMEKIPYIKELSRLAFRSEGQGFSGGVVSDHVPRGFNFEIDHDYFERVVWPAVAHRFPPLEAAKCHRTWSGLYEQNELDGNPVIGPWTDRLPNLYTVAGFSGHGMMHAPAAGRAIAELILQGAYQSIDLRKFGYQRITASLPYSELGIV